MSFLAYKIRNQIMGVYHLTSNVYANYCFGHDFAGVNLDSVLWRLCLWVPPAIVILLCVQQTLNFLQGVKEGASVPLPIPLRLYPTAQRLDVLRAELVEPALPVPSRSSVNLNF